MKKMKKINLPNNTSGNPDVGSMMKKYLTKDALHALYKAGQISTDSGFTWHQPIGEFIRKSIGGNETFNLDPTSEAAKEKGADIMNFTIAFVYWAVRLMSITDQSVLEKKNDTDHDTVRDEDGT